MGVDLTGGLDADREHVFGERPADPEMRESVNVWMWDEGDDVGFPRIGVEAVADRWDTHDVQASIAFADGRVLRLWAPGPSHDPMVAGSPRRLGAGPLSFELVEPFAHWRLRLDGLLEDSTVERQMAGEWGGGDPTVPVELDVDIRAAVPPWENGTLLPEAGRVLAEQEEGDLMGGPRYEQLFRMTGRLRVDGGPERELRGGGLRIRRQGVRRLARFWGHLWQSSVFPSGRAFGCLCYPARDDGRPTYNEGYLFDGDGDLVPARVVEAPWLRRMQPRGERVEVVLEAADGRTEVIRGETLVSVSAAIPVTSEMSFPVLHQSIVRYSWGDETANGMMERSTLPEQMEPA